MNTFSHRKQEPEKGILYIVGTPIGNLNDIKKLPTKINSNPIIIEGSIIYLDKKNRLSIVD